MAIVKRRPRIACGWRVLVGGALSVGLVGCGEETVVGADGGIDRASLEVCETDVRANSEKELAALEGCELLRGRFIPRRGDLDFSPAGSLQVIEGDLGVEAYASTPFTFEALSSLVVVDGRLAFNSAGITSFKGLESVYSLGGIYMQSMPYLESFEGLDGLREVRGDLRVTYSKELRSLKGLEQLERVHGELVLNGNPKLPSEEVDAFLARVQVDGRVVR